MFSKWLLVFILPVIVPPQHQTQRSSLDQNTAKPLIEADHTTSTKNLNMDWSCLVIDENAVSNSLCQLSDFRWSGSNLVPGLQELLGWPNACGILVCIYYCFNGTTDLCLVTQTPGLSRINACAAWRIDFMAHMDLTPCVRSTWIFYYSHFLAIITPVMSDWNSKYYIKHLSLHLAHLQQ